MKGEHAVFLSAGIPVKHLEKWRPDVLAIREAVLALVAVVVPRRALVFGGHPAISPLVEHAARSLGAAGNVFIYQSGWYEDVIPPEAKAFKNFILTRKFSTPEESLREMREKMLASKHFSAGVFIGGKDGILAEFDMFQAKWPQARTIPVASTGGAARMLWEKRFGQENPHTLELLATSKRYRGMFRNLLEDI